MDQYIEGEEVTPTNQTQDVAPKDLFKLDKIVNVMRMGKGLKSKKDKAGPLSPSVASKHNLKPEKLMLIVNSHIKSSK